MAVVAFTAIPGRTAEAEGLLVSPLDGLLTVSLIGSAALTEVLLQGKLPLDLGRPDIESVNPLDRLAVLGYSRWADVTSTVFEYGAFLGPAVFALLLPIDQAGAAWLVYAESLILAFSFRSLGKLVFNRQRPWMYTDSASPPPEEKEAGNDSFPSGHATMSFAAAASAVTILLLCLPGSPYLLPFAAAEAGLAALTSSLRVAAGMHFVTDVLAGAALGAVCGLVIPLAHMASLGTFVSGSPRGGVGVPLLTIPL
jgi:membrane-associated phospholipid phosphatase